MLILDILIITLQPIETLTSAMFRTLAITRGLSEQGHNVDFLCIPDNQLQSKKREQEFLKDINIIRTASNGAFLEARKIISGEKKTFKKFVVKFARKLWHMFCVYDNTIRIANNVSISSLPKKEYDVIISSSDPKSSHIAAMNLINQGLKYKKWVQYWGDPLALDISKENIYPRCILKYIEGKIIKNANKVVYVSPFTMEKQKNLLPKYADQMAFYPIAYMEEKIYPPTKNEVFTLGYYGNYDSMVRNIIPFYVACKKFNEDIHVDIIGDSDLRLEATEHICIYPRGDILNFEANADLIVCVLNSFGTQIPGKIYHAAGTNKKILVIVDGDYTEQMKAYLNSFNRYFICDNNIESIVEGIRIAKESEATLMPLKELNYQYISKALIE